MSWIEMNPAEYNIFMCFETAGRLMSKFSARLLMVRLSFESSFSIFLLLGSAMTWKTSRVGCAMFCSVYTVSHLIDILKPATGHTVVYSEVFCFRETAVFQEKFSAGIFWLQFPDNHSIKS